MTEDNNNIMKTISQIIFTFSAVLFLVSCCLYSYTRGIEDGRSSVYEFAAKRHFGYWYCESNGTPHFRWYIVD